MDDTIYRQDAIDALDCINGAEEVLRSLPSAQPEPGKWNKFDGDVFNCLNCGHTFSVMQGAPYMHFCPNCGARMEEESDGGNS